MLFAAAQLVGQGSGEKPKRQMRALRFALGLADSRGCAHNKNSKAAGAAAQFPSLGLHTKMRAQASKQVSRVLGYPVLSPVTILVCPLPAMHCKTVSITPRDGRPLCTRGLGPEDTCMSAPHKGRVPMRPRFFPVFLYSKLCFSFIQHLKRNNRHFGVERVNLRLEMRVFVSAAVDPTSILPSSVRSERYVASSRPCLFRPAFWFRPGPRCAHAETFLIAIMAILTLSAKRVRTSDIQQYISR